MICPHCGKAIQLIKRTNKELVKKALLLYQEGFSVRDIERKLDYVVSFVTISRWVKEIPL